MNLIEKKELTSFNTFTHNTFHRAAGGCLIVSPLFLLCRLGTHSFECVYFFVYRIPKNMRPFGYPAKWAHIISGCLRQIKQIRLCRFSGYSYISLTVGKSNMQFLPLF